MNIFKRIFRIGQAEIHSVVDKMEDPVKMTEQGIREMQQDLDQALEAYAKVKSLAIRTQNEANKKQEESANYEKKAVTLLEKAQKNELSVQDADRLAKEALGLKKQLYNEAIDLDAQAIIHEKSAQEVYKNVEVLKFNISKWENELKLLKARVKVSSATKMVNKQLAKIDSNSTIGMLERMKEKVEDDEALAQAYADLSSANKSVIDEIDNAISTQNLDDDLDQLKKKNNL